MQPMDDMTAEPCLTAAIVAIRKMVADAATASHAMLVKIV